MSINKAVLYIVLASVITCVAMIYIANRMQAKPNKVQMAVEVIYDIDPQPDHPRQPRREDGRASGSRSWPRSSSSSSSRTSSA